MEGGLELQYKTAVAHLAVPGSLKQLEIAASVIFGVSSPWLCLQEKGDLQPLGLNSFRKLQKSEGRVVVFDTLDQPQPTLQRPRPLLSSTETCPVCFEIFRHPLVSKCGHVCCEECWASLLTSKLECPICRARARMKTLREV
jgi:hypothetical protein